MSFLSFIPIIGQVLDKIIGDKRERDDAKAQIRKLELEGQLLPILRQIEVNIQEGGHRSIFVAGWRPMVGWVCALGFAWHFLLLPIIAYVVSLTGHPVPELVFDISSMTAVLAAMLGVPVAAFRTFEKSKGIDNAVKHDKVITAEEFLSEYTKKFKKVTPTHKKIVRRIFEKLDEGNR